MSPPQVTPRLGDFEHAMEFGILQMLRTLSLAMVPVLVVPVLVVGHCNQRYCRARILKGQEKGRVES